MNTKNVENPAFSDLREMEVLRFLFELKREQIDPTRLQKMLTEHQMQNQIRQINQQNEAKVEQTQSSSESQQSNFLRQSLSSSSVESLSGKEVSSRSLSTPEHTQNCMIPEPKIVFQYVPSPRFPTPTQTPEPVECSEEPIDYSKAVKRPSDFEFNDRCNFIKFNEGRKTVSPPTPTPSTRDSDSDQDNYSRSSKLKKLALSSSVENWCGSSVYNNLPELVMTEYDKILRDSHNLKVEVIKTLNNEFPVNYEYNPKKSRIRTNYSDPQVADERTRNNIASRRSRQRKKFQTQMIQYSVDYDNDENFLLAKQETWLRAIIDNLEQKALSTDNGFETIRKLRKQCGFE